MSLIPRCAVCDDALPDPYGGETHCGGGVVCARFPTETINGEKTMFETVKPDELRVGDEVKGNGALWRVLSFGTWRGLGLPERNEYLEVECVSMGVRPFDVGYRKQFARYPRGGTWERKISK